MLARRRQECRQVHPLEGGQAESAKENVCVPYDCPQYFPLDSCTRVLGEAGVSVFIAEKRKNPHMAVGKDRVSAQIHVKDLERVRVASYGIRCRECYSYKKPT